MNRSIKTRPEAIHAMDIDQSVFSTCGCVSFSHDGGLLGSRWLLVVLGGLEHREEDLGEKDGKTADHNGQDHHRLAFGQPFRGRHDFPCLHLDVPVDKTNKVSHRKNNRRAVHLKRPC